MGMRVLGIGALAASRSPEDVLTAFALGSCVAVVVHYPGSGVTGMAHVALPGNPRDRNRQQSVGYYADTAIPALIREVERQGGVRHGRGLSVKLIGGASILGTMAGMNIGKRNVLGVRRALWRLGLGPIAEEIGGSVSRTVRVRVSDAQTTVSTPGLDPLLL